MGLQRWPRFQPAAAMKRAHGGLLPCTLREGGPVAYACPVLPRHNHPSTQPPSLPLVHATGPAAVGNFSSGEAAEFLSAMRRVAGERCQLLLCTDMWKDSAVLHAAYDDSQGER